VSEVFFFGCHGRPGHELWAPGWLTTVHPLFGLGWDLDGEYAPRLTREGGVTSMSVASDSLKRFQIRHASRECPQGQYLRHVRESRGGTWTIVSWWDRCQGDERESCNSTVLMEGGRPAGEVLSALRKNFPGVLENLARRGVELCPVPDPVPVAKS